jgi:hypothetical protein
MLRGFAEFTALVSGNEDSAIDAVRKLTAFYAAILIMANTPSFRHGLPESVRP